jgi:hypothetical protein
MKRSISLRDVSFQPPADNTVCMAPLFTAVVAMKRKAGFPANAPSLSSRFMVSSLNAPYGLLP